MRISRTSIAIMSLFSMAAGGVGQTPLASPKAPIPATKSTQAVPTALAPPSASPTLSASTVIALGALGDQRNKLVAAENQWTQELKGVDGDVRKAFPGWHVNPQTLQVERDSADKGEEKP